MTFIMTAAGCLESFGYFPADGLKCLFNLAGKPPQNLRRFVIFEAFQGTQDINLPLFGRQSGKVIVDRVGGILLRG